MTPPALQLFAVSYQAHLMEHASHVSVFGYDCKESLEGL